MVGRIKRVIKRILFSYMPSATVLMFHHIDDGNIIQKSGCVLDKKKFLEMIDSGICFISIDEYFSYPYSKYNPCTITFDDALSDIYTVAYPELKKRKIPFTVFVITDFLDTEGYITTDELVELSEDPLVTIGSHGVSHRILSGMEPEQQEEELLFSKERLETIIKKQVQYFAYSHGQYDTNTLAILDKKQIYKGAFVAGGGATNMITKKNKYLLPRLNCENGLNTFEITNKNGEKCLVPKI